MRSTAILCALSALGAVTYAQQDTTTILASSGALASTSNGLTGRESLVTLVTTDVATITSTDINNIVVTTTLPKSIRTYTTDVIVGTTLVPVLTPSVIYSQTVVRTNTLSDGSLSTATEVVVTSAAPGTSTGAVVVATTSVRAGAAATAIPFAIGGVLVGVAALL